MTSSTTNTAPKSDDSWAETLSLDGFTEAASEFLSQNGKPLVDSIATKARENPVAFAAAGLSVAWLIYGTATRNSGQSGGQQHLSEFERRVRAADGSSSSQSWKASAADLRAKISDGTESLSESARKRVVKAREQAVAAQEQIEESASYYARKAAEGMRSQPLLAGALAAAAGSVLAAMLPGSDQEDRLFGAKRDELLAEADRIYREELAKLNKSI